MKKGRKNGKCEGREAAEAMAKEAKKNDMILRSSGIVHVDGSNNFASVCSKKGQKGVNQDCCIVWEVYMLKLILKNICFLFHIVMRRIILIAMIKLYYLS